jgi:adenine specific DNA methylase Mod
MSWWDAAEFRQNWVNKLFYGDNLDILRDRIPADSIDLIYLDPPFNSQRSYNVLFPNKHGTGAIHAQIEAFDDTWTWTQEADRVTSTSSKEERRPNSPTRSRRCIESSARTTCSPIS